MLDTYSSHALLTVIEERASDRVGEAFFKNTFFTGAPQFSEDERVYFDVVDSARRLAPYVSPVMEGKVMEWRGYATRWVEVPYVKPKHVINPVFHMRSRLPGEALGGSMSLQARRAAKIAEAMDEEELAVLHREEVQAAEAIRLGQVTISGEGYGTRVVSFGRDASLTVVLAGAATWDNAGVDPLADIEGWGDTMHGLIGASPNEWYLGLDAWGAFKDRLTAQQKLDLLDSMRGSRSRMELGPQRPDYVKYRGTLGEYDFFTISESYQDEDGTDVELLPPKEVCAAVPGALEGRAMYGAILDPKAIAGGMTMNRLFPKNWVTDDPGKEFTMTQSAPLMVPLRPNASFGATVLP